MSNEYHFITKWEVEYSVEEVLKVLSDSTKLMEWWPSVYLDVKVLETGADNGLGQTVSLHTRGLLPYTLKWQFRITEVNLPESISLKATGDLEGRGIWFFTPTAKGTKIIYDWKVEAEKPILKYLSFLLKPLFSFNHEWAMAKGLESLKVELMRRDPNNKDKVIPPPPPPPGNEMIYLFAVKAIILAIWLFLFFKKRK